MCWGAKGFDVGQTAVPESFQKDATVVAAGGDHTCATNTKGKLDCWGGNENGQSSQPKTDKFPCFLDNPCKTIKSSQLNDQIHNIPQCVDKCKGEEQLQKDICQENCDVGTTYAKDLLRDENGEIEGNIG